MPNGYPLNGLRVLDLSRVLAGPWASQTLADLGADVIKIENPNGGDDTRKWGPPYIKNNEDKISAYFCATNRGKKSLSVDISSEKGQLTIRELLNSCDILIENFKVGGLAKFGLDFESLKADYPRLIYCSITGFGQTGPDAHKPGYDFMIQAMGGLMSITGDKKSGPMKVGVAVTDLFTGMYAVTAIQAAIIERFSSGLGQHIDLALFDCQLAMLANQAGNSLNGQITPELMGNKHPNIVPYQSFKSQDGYFIIAIGNDSQFATFCALVGKPWAKDERYSTNENRVVNREQLVKMIEAVTEQQPTEYWLTILAENIIPVGRINNVTEALAEPQAIARGMVTTAEIKTIGQVKLVSTPIKMSRSVTGAKTAPPLLNQNSEDE